MKIIYYWGDNTWIEMHKYDANGYQWKGEYNQLEVDAHTTDAEIDSLVREQCDW